MNIKKILGGMAAMALLVTASAASAETPYWSNSGWAVFDNSTDDVALCALATIDEGNGSSSLHSHVAMAANGYVAVVFSNKDWNIQTQEVTGMSLLLLDMNGEHVADYSGGKWERTDRNGFMVGVQEGETFLNEYARSRDMGLFRQADENSESVLAGFIDLTGSALAVSKLRECVSVVHTNLNRRKERERNRPVNPF